MRRGSAWRCLPSLLPLLSLLGACAEGYAEQDQQAFAIESMSSEALLRQLNRHEGPADGLWRGDFALSGPCRLRWKEGQDRQARSLLLTATQRVTAQGSEGLYRIGIASPGGAEQALFVTSAWTERVVLGDTLQELLLRCRSAAVPAAASEPGA